MKQLEHSSWVLDAKRTDWLAKDLCSESLVVAVDLLQYGQSLTDLPGHWPEHTAISVQLQQYNSHCIRPWQLHQYWQMFFLSRCWSLQMISFTSVTRLLGAQHTHLADHISTKSYLEHSRNLGDENPNSRPLFFQHFRQFKENQPWRCTACQFARLNAA